MAKCKGGPIACKAYCDYLQSLKAQPDHNKVLFAAIRSNIHSQLASTGRPTDNSTNTTNVSKFRIRGPIASQASRDYRASYKQLPGAHKALFAAKRSTIQSQLGPAEPTDNESSTDNEAKSAFTEITGYKAQGSTTATKAD